MTDVTNESLIDEDCSICLQTCVYPVQLPCDHIFCYLCVKGCSFHRRRCPLCRARFSYDFFKNPKLVERTQACTPCRINTTTRLESDVSTPQTWFYEGYNGWWQYEPRTAIDLEKEFISGRDSFELMIAGYLYVIDFKNMSQFRKDQTGRMRRIKRDFANSEKLGVAGIKLHNRNNLASHQSDSSQSD